MPRITYVSWPAAEITGGIKAIFQHVELLLEAGLHAAVATPDGQRPAWFETAAPVLALDAIRAEDVLVFPENNPQFLERFAAAPQRKLVFCQNPYYVFQGLAGRRSYADFGVSALLAASHTVVQFAHRRFPQLPVHYTPFFIDERRFGPPARKVLQIACIPRKRPLEMGALHDLFRGAYPQYAGLTWQVLQGATEAQVAQVLGQSAVYLSLARLEAHGMTTLEAMASGCIVAGFCGVAGGSDSATAANGFWAAEDDVIGAADRLAQAVQLAATGGPAYETMVAAGVETAWRYRREEAARRLVEFWRAFA
ncbi:MAG TPA: hypothetical protein VEA40_27710 [Ramlibacter sp.]|nr:hypothetical protein [Ramlibacter sp.]